MTTLEAMYAALDARREVTPRRPAEPFAQLPPATAPCGPNAARTAAYALAFAGAHSHLHAYGETVCLTRQCEPDPDLLRGTR